MTSQDMKREFLVLYDKVTNFSAPGYEDIEISLFLTKAQERVVLSIYNPLGNRTREGFEATEARRKELKELVKGVTISTPYSDQTQVLPNGKFYELPEDCLFVISEEVTVASSDNCQNSKRVNVKPITHDEYNINKENPFKKPDFLNFIWRLDYKDRLHELITDGTFTVTDYHIRYIKRLKPIIVGTGTVDGETGPLDSELDQIIHKRIIDEAVKIATGITDPALYQIKSLEQQAGES